MTSFEENQQMRKKLKGQIDHILEPLIIDLLIQKPSDSLDFMITWLQTRKEFFERHQFLDSCNPTDFIEHQSQGDNATSSAHYNPNNSFNYNINRSDHYNPNSVNQNLNQSDNFNSVNSPQNSNLSPTNSPSNGLNFLRRLDFRGSAMIETPRIGDRKDHSQSMFATTKDIERTGQQQKRTGTGLQHSRHLDDERNNRLQSNDNIFSMMLGRRET